MRTPNPLGDLLRQIREGMGQSIPGLAAKLGVNKNTLSSYEHGRVLPDLEFLGQFAHVTGWDVGKLLQARVDASQFSAPLRDALKRIQEAAFVAARFATKRSGIGARDLARIQDEAFSKGLDTDGVEAAFGGEFPAERERAADLRLESPRAGYVYIPLYDVNAAAGKGALVERESVSDVLAFKRDWIRQELHAQPADLSLIYVEGDSMEPDLRAGDIVLLDHTDTRARREGVYVIRMDGALLVKQLQRLPGGIVKVISRNAAYEPFTVKMVDVDEPNGFAVIGRVVWACRRY